MPLYETIRNDLRENMKAGDAVGVSVRRFIVAQLQNREIEKHGAGKSSELTDDDVLDVLNREVKKRRESIDLFKKGGRADLADKEQKELEIVSHYLPAEMSKEEVSAILDELIAQGNKDFPSLMKAASPKLKGRADGRLIADLAREKLSS